MLFVSVCLSFFFFKQKTAYEMRISDWSSDVCSSDLLDALRGRLLGVRNFRGYPEWLGEALTAKTTVFSLLDVVASEHGNVELRTQWTRLELDRKSVV